jgi:hypothetical protein
MPARDAVFAQRAAGEGGAGEPSASGRNLLLTLGVDLVAPLAIFYALRAGGAGNVPALILAAVVPGLHEAIHFIRTREHDSLAIFLMGMTVIGIAATLGTGSPRLLLAKDGLLTLVSGVWFLASIRGSRPLGYRFTRPLLEGRGTFGTASWESLWQADPRFRRIWNVATAVWGIGLIVDAGIRVGMAYALPVAVVPALNTAQWVVMFLVIQLITNIYYTRAGLWRMLGAPFATRGSTAHPPNPDSMSDQSKP